jgi:LPXTG-motif cell wall-anchored protein
MLLRRSALAGFGLALAAALAAQPAQAAQPANAATDQPAPAAAGWLADQLVDGERLETEFGGDRFPDQGLTIDAVLGFAAAGVAGADADSAMHWLAGPEVLSGYVGDGEAEAYAGAHAKLALSAQVQGLDPTSFGGVDLLARLLTLLDGTGRFSDRSQFGDFSNAFSQSFAILALARTPAGAAPEAVAFQLAAQCPDDGFPEQFAADPCRSDVDSTAMVVQALLAAGQDPTAALDWLAGQQHPDGGFGSGAGNANSTGLAAQALRAGGRDAAADQAVTFLTGLQVGCDGPADQRGSIRTSADQPGDVPRATAQGILGLAGVGMADLDGTTAQAEAARLGCGPAPSPTPAPPGGKGGELPVTGDPIVVLAAVGAGLAGAGGLTLWVTRRRRYGAGTAAG